MHVHFISPDYNNSLLQYKVCKNCVPSGEQLFTHKINLDTLHLRWVQKHSFVAPKNAEHREARQVDDSRGVEKKA